MWIVYGLNIYDYGKCDCISFESLGGKEKMERHFWFILTYKILSAIPLCTFSAYILMSLTYKSFISLFDFILKQRVPHAKANLQKQASDSVFWSICYVDDDFEILYTHSDFLYVLDLLNAKKVKTYSGNNNVMRIVHTVMLDNKNITRDSLLYSKVCRKSKENFLKKLFSRIYDWDSNFRFSARFTSTLVVGLVALYYFFLFILYNASIYVSVSVEKDGSSAIPYLIFVFIVPVLVAFFLTLVQVLLFARETKRFFKEMYKGKCDFVSYKISNSSIATSSSHFGGYFVGYLLWG